MQTLFENIIMASHVAGSYLMTTSESGRPVEKDCYNKIMWKGRKLNEPKNSSLIEIMWIDILVSLEQEDQ